MTRSAAATAARPPGVAEGTQIMDQLPEAGRAAFYQAQSASVVDGPLASSPATWNPA